MPSKVNKTWNYNLQYILNLFIDPAIYLSLKLDEKTFSRGFSYIWAQWTRRPHIQVTSVGGCLFKLLLWFVRYCKVKTFNGNLHKNITSVSDIVFDIILFMEYIQGSPIPNDINEFVGDKYYSPLFGINVTCAQYNSTADVCDQYVKKDYWFAILTLFFIYLPSVNVIATLYGPRTAGAVGIRMSPGMAGYVGGSFALYCYTARLSELSSPADSIIGWLGWFILILSSGFLGMALVNFFSKGDVLQLPCNS